VQKLRYALTVLLMLLCLATTAAAQVSIGIGLPNVSIGINLPLFPQLVPVPGYPVYYAPQVNANYFFYDGMYWVYQDDNWYASSWYNGPWGYVEPEVVPLFILRIPVRYYRQPPVYFRGWQSNAPPRWGEHWGHDWEQRRSGWNQWNRRSAPNRAPLPVYQRQYSGDRYPRVEQQHSLHSQQYRYQPRAKTVQQHYKQQGEYRAPAPHDDQRQHHDQMQHHDQRQQNELKQQREQAPRSHDQKQRSQDRGASQEPNRGQGQGQNKDDDRGRGRDK